MGLFDRLKKDKKSSITEEKYEIVKIYDIEFPFYIDLYKTDWDEENDNMIELGGKDAFEYLSSDNIEEVCLDFESSELHQYFDDLGGKIIQMKMRFLENGFIRLSVSAKDMFSEEEKQKLLKFISGQMSDGWGEGNFDYEKDTGETYSIRFWKYNDWSIGYIE